MQTGPPKDPALMFLSRARKRDLPSAYALSDSAPLRHGRARPIRRQHDFARTGLP